MHVLSSDLSHTLYFTRELINNLSMLIICEQNGGYEILVYG